MMGAVVGFAFAAGGWLLMASWIHHRRPELDDRLLPYLRDVQPTSPDLVDAPSALDAVFGPAVRRAAQAVGSMVGGSASVSARLDRLGRQGTVEQFRIRQVLWGLAGFGACACLAMFWLARNGNGSVSLLVMCAAGFAAGVFGCDNALSSAVRAHEQRMSEEFPTVADLLALAVAAGESPVAGLERVARVCHGDLAMEIDRVLADIRTGASVQQAFDNLAARTGVASIARFAEGLAVAVERGTPLVDVLHAQAADVRESSRRRLIEAGGRKEVAMMIPVVFLILPITIIFAFYPGWVGLHLTSGM